MILSIDYLVTLLPCLCSPLVGDVQFLLFLWAFSAINLADLPDEPCKLDVLETLLLDGVGFPALGDVAHQTFGSQPLACDSGLNWRRMLDA